MIAAAVAVTAASLILPWLSSFWPVAISQATAHAAGVVFGPALAAVTLGIVGHRAFTRRIGRNETFNHAGNVCAASAAGALAYLWGPKVVFFLLASMAIASTIGVLAIPERAIDHDLARGLHDVEASGDRPSGLSVLLTCRPLLIFAGCAIMFHFANAAMLPLVGQKLALQDKNLGTSLMAACILAAQLVMVPMAMLVGTKADAWGRKPLFLIALLVLTIRGCLYPLSDDPYSARLLAIAGWGGRGHLWRGFSRDRRRSDARHRPLQRGAGCHHHRPRHRRGIVHVALAGYVVVYAGYSAAFLTLAGVALLALRAMPETWHPGERQRSDEIEAEAPR